MNFGGQYVFAAPRHSVWEALNNAGMLRAAIPGCTRLEWVSDTALEATITVNLGIAKPTFMGDLILSDVLTAEKYTLTGKGRGGLLGLIHATAEITLDDHEEGTLLIFSATGGASRRIMALGKTLVGTSAQKIIDHFFVRFATAMGTSITVSGKSTPDQEPINLA